MEATTLFIFYRSSMESSSSKTRLLQAAQDAVQHHTPAVLPEAETNGSPLVAATEWTVSTWNDNNNAANQRSIAIATHFIAHVLPEMNLATSSSSSEPQWDVQDRLVKMGRNISSIVEMSQRKSSVTNTEDKEETALKILLDEYSLVFFPSHTKNAPVPKIRFGRTELQISMATLGCMRLQQTWTQDVLHMDQVQPHCQDTLVRLLKYALVDLRINHIETARAYGSSEIQLGNALQQLFQEGLIRRKDLILQTKIGVMKPMDFRKTLETSLQHLKQVEYVDLLAIHGFNLDSQWDTVMVGSADKDGEEESLLDIVKEYQQLGKIRFVGFSSHGRVELISRIIQTDKFDYVNLHYHPFSSYTASGEGLSGSGNLQNVLLANKHDMGVFIISPYDKGGRLYAPSVKLRQLTLPEMEPIVYGTLWHWAHPTLYMQQRYSQEPTVDPYILPEIHTISCGAARPSDLDQIAYATHLWTHHHETTVKKLLTVQQRIFDEQVRVLGKDWLEKWFIGLPNCSTEDDAYQVAQMVSLYNLIQSLGLLDYAKDRYGAFDGNLSKWDFNLSTRENIQTKVNRIGWGYMPGLAIEEDKDYSHLLSNVPEENKEKVLEALDFVRRICSKHSDNKDIPFIEPEWETSYDMRPWTAYPDQKK